MKKKFALLLIANTILSVFCNAQDLLNLNGGFEEATVDETSASDWTLMASDGATAVFTIVGTNAQEGKNALKAEVTALGTNTWSVQVVNENIPVEEGKMYKYSIWARSETDGATVNFTVGTPSYSELKRISGVLTTEWTKYSAVVVNTTETTLRTPSHITSTGIFYFDNSRFVETQLQSATVDKTGDTLVLQAGWNLEVNENINVTDFQVKTNKTANTVTQIVQHAKYPKNLYLVLGTHVKPKDSVWVSYTGTSIKYTTASGAPVVALGTFNKEEVTNTSAPSTNVLNDESIARVSVFPNPVGRNLTFTNSGKIINVEIYNLEGRILRSVKYDSGVQINVSDLKTGMYIAKLQLSDGSAQITKFVKR